MTSSGVPCIRLATEADADAIAELHVRSWQSAYRGLLSDAYLDGPLAAEKAAHWPLAIRHAPPKSVVLVAEVDDGLVGFAAVWPDKTDASVGYIDNFHAAPGHRRLGIGRALLTAVGEHLTERGYRGAALTVLTGNTAARAFYRRMGGREGVTRTVHIGGTALTDIRVEWPTLAQIGAAPERIDG